MDNQLINVIEIDEVGNIDEVNTELDLFSEELEDHFNAAMVSSAASASSATGTWSSFSTYCSAY